MKQMPYIIIAVTTFLIVGSVLVGCSTSPTKHNETDIAGVSLSQGHMDYFYCYSFFLRKEDDKVLFDADARLAKENEAPVIVVLESCEVDSKYFDELINFVNNNKVQEHVNSYKKKPQLWEAMDKTTNTTTLYFADGTDKSADSGAYEEELRKFFTDLALLYKDMSVSINQ